MVLPVCCPFNSRALIFPKCALPWENGHMFPTMGITNSFFFLQKKLVIQGKHIAMHYSNPRPKFEDWLCNKVSLCSPQIELFWVFVCSSKQGNESMQSPAFIIGWYLGRPVYTLEDRISGTLEILFIKIQVLTKPRVLIKILGLFYFTVFLFRFVF